MKYIRLIVFIGLFCSLAFHMQSQYYENPEKKEGFWDKLYFGGGLGLTFGSVTHIEFAPTVGYKLTERIHPGIGLTYSYTKDNRYSTPFEYSTYGGSVFCRFFLFEGLFAHVEAEALNIKVYTFTSLTSYEEKRQWIDNYYIGGGYYQKIGERSGAYILVLWNLNQTDLSPYENPVIRVGFNF